MTNETVAALIASFDKDEVWRAVEGWPEYEVSSWGGVRRIGRRVLAQAKTQGYPHVDLSSGGVAKAFRVHRLVAAAFLGPPPFADALVAHNDGDPANNRVSNLRWASARENQIDRARHNTHCRGSAVFGAKLRE